MKKKKTIAVWFSCGAASAVAAKKTIEMYGEKAIIRVVNNPVAEEDADNRRFLADVEKWLGIEIEIATNPKYRSNSCVEVWETRKFMSGVSGAPCTIELKKMARQRWEEENRPDYHVLGFTYDERNRARNFRMTERENLVCPLITHKLTKKDCFAIIRNAGIELPRIYKVGYPNANCIGCVKATSPTYWNHVRKMHPEVFAERANQSRRLGARLVRVSGERMFLDELPVDAVGEPMKSMRFECGIFCEEKVF
jgi:PP-loop superfamily ATP-utilizing enzyme